MPMNKGRILIGIRKDILERMKGNPTIKIIILIQIKIDTHLEMSAKEYKMDHQTT